MALGKGCPAIALLLAACMLSGCIRSQDPPARADQVMEAGSGRHWYRGNLHAHTLWSDGDAAPDAVAGWYRDHGYHFLALSEHDLVAAGERWVGDTRLLRHDELAARFNQPGRFLVLQAEEISDAVGPVSVHLNAMNIAQAVAPARADTVGRTIQENFSAAAALGEPGSGTPLLQLNHPNFTWSITAEHVMRLEGGNLFEIYNGHPLSNTPGDGMRPSTERLWDIALAWRLDMLGLPLLYATATDDAHHYHGIGGAGPGRGWIMVLADTLEPAALADAARRGHFYASTGVRLARIVATGDRMQIEVAREPGVDYLIEFIGTKAGFDATATPPVSATGRPIYASQRYSADIGRTLASHRGDRATYRFEDDDLYVRARITSSRRHPNPSHALQHEQAWVQPVVGPAGFVPARSGIEPPPAPAPELQFGVTRRFQPMAAEDTAALISLPQASCNLELLTDGQGRVTTAFVRAQRARFAGWLADPAAANAPGSLAVLLVADLAYIAEGGPGRPRPDVAEALGKPAFEGAGFDLDFELHDVATGSYRVWLTAFHEGKAIACNTGKALQVG